LREYKKNGVQAVLGKTAAAKKTTDCSKITETQRNFFVGEQAMRKTGTRYTGGRRK